MNQLNLFTLLLFSVASVALSEDAAESFRPPTAERISAAANELAAALAGVERNFYNSSGWRDYLLLDELKQVAEAGGIPDTGLLEELRRRLTRDVQGLSLPSLVRLRDAIKLSLTVARSTVPGQGEDYARAVELIKDSPLGSTPEKRVLAACQWLEDRGQQTQTLKRLQDSNRLPNIYLYINPRTLTETQATQSTTTPIAGSLAGAAYRGHAKSQTTTRLRALPNQHAATLELLINGSVDADTHSSESGVSVSGGGLYRYSSRAVLTLNGSRWSAGQATISDSYNADRPRVSVPRGLFSETKRRRASEGYYGRTGAAGSQLESDVRAVLQQGVEEAAAKLNAAMIQNSPTLARLDVSPTASVSYSNNSEFVIGYELSTPGGLANSGPPSRSLAQGTNTLLLHQSAVNHLFSTMFPRGRLSLNDLMERLGFESNVDDEEIWLNLPNQGAAEVQLADSRITLTIHPQSLETSKAKYAAMDLVIQLRQQNGYLLSNQKPQVATSSLFPSVGAAGIRNVAARRVIGGLLEKSDDVSVNIDQLTRQESWTAVDMGVVRAMKIHEGWIELTLQ